MEKTRAAPIPESRFVPSAAARRWLAFAAAIAAVGRLLLAADAARTGDLDPLIAYGFTVIFPLVLLLAILSLGPSRTREGILMRIATCCQLILVMALPPLSLYFLLGLPVAFLLVELFETRMPRVVREPIAMRLVSC
jgi:hypothetical protein